ncbi:MAG: CDP-alcohol phosphatidyltransferase family protein [Candidatus Harrisonbacteria bacterium]|nr:CDP-alcohol phosphatidyltransferase family protein [Candidatus Harrisonbacteria bacterium]
MKKQQPLKKTIQKIKERGQEERRKIKKLIIKRKDDFLTALEKNWRDWALQPLTKLFYRIGVTANQITYLGFILIGMAVWMYLQQINFQWQLLILILAGISDAIDGPTARNNNNVTVLGTWLDHIRDGALMIWGSYLIYKYNLLDLETILIIWGLQLVLIWITLKDFLIRYLRGLPSEEAEELVSHFSLDNLQASVIGRLQFFCWTVGYLLLLLFLITANTYLLTIGQTLIFLEILFTALNILESYQKVVPK